MSESKVRRRTRPRQSRRSVRVAEAIARTLISVGGIGTILAVALIMVFLVWVVAPLFRGASTSDAQRSPTPTSTSVVVASAADENRGILWTVDRDAHLCVTRLDDGSLLDERALIDGTAPTAISADPVTGVLALGFADGSVRFGAITLPSERLAVDAVPESIRGLGIGASAKLEHTLYRREDDGHVRTNRAELKIDEPLATESKSPIRAIDQVESSEGRTLATLGDDGVLSVYRVHERENMLTGEIARTFDRGMLALRNSSPELAPVRILIAGGGNMLYLVAQNGHASRIDARDLERLTVAEELELVDGLSVRMTALEFLLGRTTLLVGDSNGRVDAWFPTRPDGATSVDGVRVVRARTLAAVDPADGAVTAIAISSRSRVTAIGFADGAVDLFNVTSGKHLARVSVDRGAVRALAIAPREDGLIAASNASLSSWSLDLGHPTANLAALFRPVWYEGYVKPEHVWQSSGGDDAEPKLGMMPLVFGTLKATVYSMLFGAPLALLAALFSSEFLHARVRVPIKSTVEIMAGLPSVVLGFLAAIVIAPFVESVLAAVLAAFFTIPMSLLLGARLWQLVPQRSTLRFADWQRFLVILAMVPIGCALAALLGPAIERAFFGGDLPLWLSGGRGSALGGWLLLMLPLSAAFVMFAGGRWITPRILAATLSWSRDRCARLDLVRFVLGAVATFAIALSIASILTALGFDARGGILDTYTQRNALVVGFVMGVAIIPIIYTIAEDALSSVPEHLRLASLASGATAWQTAVRVIVPTAASGLFSALMVGLGRAVGETMIVLMATGNTPVMNWNAFSGFRTLSANLATELPEAVKNSTHYRTLFLAALLLFAITFLLNTAAELVRQRFRKRAFQL